MGMSNIVGKLEDMRRYLDTDLHPVVSPDRWDVYALLCDMVDETLALLKAQEPRVMKIGDVRNWVNSDRVTREPIVIEIRSGVCAWIIDDEVRELPGEADLSSDLYGKTWRCWTFYPTKEQREAVKWE